MTHSQLLKGTLRPTSIELDISGLTPHIDGVCHIDVTALDAFRPKVATAATNRERAR